MKSQFRPRAAAAAILLASLGAGFVATPAFAHNSMVPHQHPHVATELIQRFEMSGAAGVDRDVAYTVIGAPGGQVFLDVPGHGRFRMREDQPGTYVLIHRIVAGENPAAFVQATAIVNAMDTQAVARLGGVPAISGGVYAAAPPVVRNVPPPPPARVERDNRGPDIGDVSPSQGERVSERGRTRITAQFSDDRGVDANGVRLRVDGRDVTGASRVEANRIEYREDLAPGRHTAELTVRDRSGNSTRRTWTFDVVDSRPGHGYGDRNHEHDGRNNSNNGRW